MDMKWLEVVTVWKERKKMEYSISGTGNRIRSADSARRPELQLLVIWVRITNPLDLRGEIFHTYSWKKPSFCDNL